MMNEHLLYWKAGSKNVPTLTTGVHVAATSTMFVSQEDV